MGKNKSNVSVTEKQIKLRKRIDLNLNYWSVKLKRFPKYPNGLVVEKVRFSKDYKEIEMHYDFWFRKLREFNGSLNNKQKKELSAILKEERLKNK